VLTDALSSDGVECHAWLTEFRSDVEALASGWIDMHAVDMRWVWAVIWTRHVDTDSAWITRRFTGRRPVRAFVDIWTLHNPATTTDDVAHHWTWITHASLSRVSEIFQSILL